MTTANCATATPLHRGLVACLHFCCDETLLRSPGLDRAEPVPPLLCVPENPCATAVLKAGPLSRAPLCAVFSLRLREVPGRHGVFAPYRCSPCPSQVSGAKVNDLACCGTTRRTSAAPRLSNRALAVLPSSRARAPRWIHATRLCAHCCDYRRHHGGISEQRQPYHKVFVRAESFEFGRLLRPDRNSPLRSPRIVRVFSIHSHMSAFIWFSPPLFAVRRPPAVPDWPRACGPN